MSKTTNQLLNKVRNASQLTVVEAPATTKFVFRDAVLSVCLIALGLLPFANICNLVWNTCSNALGNDFDFVIPRVEAILQGQPIWAAFNDALVGSHSHFVPILLHAFAASVSSWDTRFELSIGIGITLLRSLLLFDCIAHSVKGPTKWAIFAVVMAYGFGTFNATIFFFGLATTVISCVVLALSIGLWGLIRFKDSPMGIGCMLAGGLLAGFCSGEWLVTWLSFLCVLLLLKAKRTAFLAWAIGISLSAAPFVLKILHGADIDATRAATLSGAVPWSKVQFFFDIIGRMMANGTGLDCRPMRATIRAAVIGVSLVPVLLGTAALLRLRIGTLAISLPLISFGLLSALQICLFRQWIATWYVNYTSPFWLGLMVLAFSVFAAAIQKVKEAPENKSKSIIGLVIGAASLVTIGVLYFQSNITYADKDYYRRSHGPSAESTMRNYRMAPTYAEPCLFSGGLGTFSRLLSVCHTAEKHHWSALGCHQNWSLQGDYVLPTVTVKQPENDQVVSFVGADGKTGSWSFPEHLDLSVPGGGSLAWSLTIPSDTKLACLYTAIRGARGSLEIVDRVNSGFPVKLVRVDHSPGKEWESVCIPLDRFKGQSIDVVFSASDESTNNPSRVIFKHPYIDVQRTYENETELLPVNQHWPSNIESSPLFPRNTKSDVVLQTRDRANFKLDGLESVCIVSSSVEAYKPKSSLQPRITYTGPLSLRARDYSHFVIELGASKNLDPRVICAQLTVNNTLKTLMIPMVADDRVHQYSYDLKLLDLNSTDKIIAVQILPVYDLSWQQDPNVELKVGSIRFVGKRD